MSICRNNTYTVEEIKNSSEDRIPSKKARDSNKTIASKNLITKDNCQSEIKIVTPDITNQNLTQTNTFTGNKICIEQVPDIKIVDNHDTSTIDHNDYNKDMIRESDIVFEIIEKKNSLEEDPNQAIRSSAQKKWGVIRNVFKVLNNMNNINTKHLRTLTDLDKTFEVFEKNYLKGNKTSTIIANRGKDEDNFFQGNFEEITKQIKFFEYVSSGKEEHITEIIDMIKNDPVRNLYDESDKHKYFVNQKNMDGFTALYITCMNGELKLTQILMKYSADHLQKCGNDKEEQSVLEVAIRWGHIKLVEYLLTLKWPVIFLKNGLKQALERKNETIIKLIRKSIEENKTPNNSKNKTSCSCFG